jgi:uncharacterized protein YrrD
MLHHINDLYEKKLSAKDGEIGHVKDFYFDDKSWALRYLVVNTGTWLTGRLVLLSPHALGSLETRAEALHVNLTRKQIENSPSIAAHRPVSRQYEEGYYQYYGWPAYWEGGGMWGAAGFPVAANPPSTQARPHHGHNQRDDIHLHSTTAVKGYHLQAADGQVGAVSDFNVNDKTWAIEALLIETGHWYAHQKIIIPTAEIERLSYEESKVVTRLTRAHLQKIAKGEAA